MCHVKSHLINLYMLGVVMTHHYKNGLDMVFGGYFTFICTSLIPNYMNPHIILTIV